MSSPMNLDGLRFAMVSSTASRVDPDAPTTFTYHQAGSLIWGEYVGDTVTEGRMVGAIDDDLLSISFAHALAATGVVVRGDATSRIERDEAGLIRLVEDFVVDGVDHVSVCVQI